MRFIVTEISTQHFLLEATNTEEALAARKLAQGRKLGGTHLHWRVHLDSSTGTGDKIAAVAQPIARGIDKVLRTKIAGCGGCKKMEHRLNAGMPITEALKLRLRGK